MPEAALDNWQPVWNAKVSISTPVCVNFELRPGAGGIHIFWFGFDAVVQGNAYKPTKEPINYHGPSGNQTHDLQTEATPPAASCPARSLHATEIVSENTFLSQFTVSYIYIYILITPCSASMRLPFVKYIFPSDIDYFMHFRDIMQTSHWHGVYIHDYVICSVRCPSTYVIPIRFRTNMCRPIFVLFWPIWQVLCFHNKFSSIFRFRHAVCRLRYSLARNYSRNTQPRFKEFDTKPCYK